MLSKALALHLAALGLVRYPAGGPGTAVRCYVEDMPSEPGAAPDDLVLIRTLPGFPATDTTGYENPEVEVMRRTAADAGVQAGFDGAEALRRIYGEGGHAITITLAAFPTIVYEYTNFNQIEADIADARVLGGIHFRYDQVAGAALGREVGTAVYKGNLRKINKPQ